MAIAFKLTVALLPSGRRPVGFASFADWEPDAFPTVGVGHPIVTVPDVRGTDARSRKRDLPEGVVQGFQVILYKVGPGQPSFACNLLAKDDCRPALGDEVEPVRPEVPLVSKPFSSACRVERLAGARTCPDRPVVRPS